MYADANPDAVIDQKNQEIEELSQQNFELAKRVTEAEELL